MLYNILKLLDFSSKIIESFCKHFPLVWRCNLKFSLWFRIIYIEAVTELKKLEEVIRESFCCMLLLELKHHLKQLYGFADRYVLKFPLFICLYCLRKIIALKDIDSKSCSLNCVDHRKGSYFCWIMNDVLIRSYRSQFMRKTNEKSTCKADSFSLVCW